LSSLDPGLDGLHAGMVLSPASQVLVVDSYTDYQSGDVVFRISATVPGCHGFWLQGSDPGFKQTYANLLMAKAAQMNVIVYAYDNQIWAGSANAYCKVRSLQVP
jgi:hypothetical protein